MVVPVKDGYINTLSFADDQTVVAQDSDNVSFMIRKLKEEYSEARLEINLAKTEYLAITEGEMENQEIEEELEIKGTGKFKYLGFSSSSGKFSENRTDISVYTELA